MIFSTVTLGAWLAKSGLSWLTPKNIARAFVAICVAYCVWLAYSWAFARGEAHQAKVDQKAIAQITDERDNAIRARDNAIAELKEYKAAYLQWYNTTRVANENLAKQNKALVQDLSNRLAAAEKRAQDLKDKNDDIPKYIPPAADITLPAGFVSLYNLSLEAPGQSSGDGISFGLGQDAGSPSGITLSQFAAVARWNNAEAVRRGVIIRLWQEWYITSKQQFTEAQQKAAEDIPRLPSENQPVSNSVVPE